MTLPDHRHATLGLRVPEKLRPTPLGSIVSGSGATLMGVFETSNGYPPPDELRQAIEIAERFLADCEAQEGALREAVSHAEIDEIRGQLAELVMSWPNANERDLTVFGRNLVERVISRRPSRYALREGAIACMELHDFVPSIAEALRAFDEAQERIRSTAFHVNELPGVLAKAKAALASAEEQQASIARFRDTRSRPATFASTAS